jgi:hypothetical protein
MHLLNRAQVRVPLIHTTTSALKKMQTLCLPGIVSDATDERRWLQRQRWTTKQALARFLVSHGFEAVEQTLRPTTLPCQAAR